MVTPLNWVKTMCIVRDGSKLLVSRDFDKFKQLHYFRPLGGSIEFGERSDEAAVREFREELGVTLINLKYLGVIENIFSMEGGNYHEIDFIYEGDIKERRIYGSNNIHAVESGVKFETLWIDYSEFKTGKLRLVPEEIFTFTDKLIQ
jgi:8-oxo-dGTP pyrophosphatase MutT (NUDIX family)